MIGSPTYLTSHDQQTLNVPAAIEASTEWVRGKRLDVEPDPWLHAIEAPNAARPEWRVWVEWQLGQEPLLGEVVRAFPKGG